MPQTKKKTTTRKKGAIARKSTKKKQQKKDSSIRYIVAIIIVILSVLGMFQLGIVGRMIDSFFNYLFGMSRYLTYILLSLITVYIAMQKKFPKTRRTFGLISLQFVLLITTQIIYHFQKGAASEREPVLSYVYKAYEHSHFPNFGGGLIGFYLLKIFIPLISIAGVIILTLILLSSSIILLLKLRHRDVVKASIDKMRNSSQSASSNFKVKREQNRLKKEERQREKEEERERLRQHQLEQEQLESEQIKDVSDFPEVSTEPEDIPIYGPSESQESKQTTTNKRKKRRFGLNSEDIDKENSSNDGTNLEDENLPESNSNDNHQMNGTISEAGEESNVAYHIPPLSLLNQPAKQQSTSKSEVQRKGQILESTMKNFGVNAKVKQIKIGPAVTQYEIQPAQGVKVSKIVNLHNDIALALAAKDVRIEAPIPGRSAVGIEVPNDKISLVTLKEVLESKFPASNKLEVGLGRDISGEPMTIQLNEMPHEVKLMLIDPKMVELNVYNGVPHLLIPVVTNPHKASQALEKVVAEMERRYDLFQHSSTRNIEGYNKFIRRQNEELDEKQAELPYIVVIVDELADLMMVAGKEVENAIQRITQMARAAGIHLIVATQRPSVDVITGIIKNNIPSRIAFAVSSQTDSRTIIGSGGAEKLLGKGDMLYVGNGESAQTRVQGAFLSDQEVQDVVNYVVEQQKANYVKEMEPDAPVDKSEMKSEDALYEDAYIFVIEQQKASTSLLQRQFRIGYNRASRLMDDLERNQVIGPQKGSKPRQVLVNLDDEEV